MQTGGSEYQCLFVHHSHYRNIRKKDEFNTTFVTWLMQLTSVDLPEVENAGSQGNC